MDCWSALEVYKEMLLLYLDEGRQLVNTNCEELEPWQIIGATLISTLGAVWVKGFLFQQETLTSRIKKQCFPARQKNTLCWRGNPDPAEQGPG
ncbi:hypothetical protein J4Q44_G00008740 [Coregonus suidteri]|uniref:Uncharacterized protein n=1 Tax=Coregonus suidteri TaxID=861788 RepID=A0AAN8R863_9TELE